MQAEVRIWLHDIHQSITEIESYFAGSPQRFDTFAADTKTKRAVERNVEIIGEAMNRVLAQEPAIAITNARAMIDTRNRIIHAYDRVSADILWSIVIKHIPLLKEEVERLLTAEDDEPKHRPQS